MTTHRLGLHVDIDALFVAIEQQRNPSLRGKPVIVGAGVIASYEARRFGLKTGSTLTEVELLCPQAVIIEGDARVRAERGHPRDGMRDTITEKWVDS
jgi:DNA polymerase-4